jgi:hypothetical protein
MKLISPIPLVLILTLAAAPSTRGAEPTFPPKVSIDEIRHRIDAANHKHPRLLATPAELKGLAASASKDPLKKTVADTIIQQALALEKAEPVKRELQGRRLLAVSRRCAQRVLTLATAYHLTGDTKFAKRAQKEMLAAARFSDWNPSHFLDVAEMTFALAIGYDWLYDQLDDPSRNEIRTAIVEKSLKLPFETTAMRGSPDPAHKETTAMRGSPDPAHKWVHARNNWGQVCHGGLTAGALAVMDDESDLAARTVKSALDNVVISMAAYAPHGSFPEGPGYWSYGTSYNVLLIANLESVFGTDFGLTAAPGFSETGQYPAMVCGPSGQFFNYADGHAGRSLEPILFWFASRFRRPDWLLGERELWTQQLGKPGSLRLEGSKLLMPLALLWMKNSESAAPVKMPLNWSPGGAVPISIHRSSWTDPHATFVGVKAGLHTASHRHLDAGSFVLDSDGVHWATDLGAEGYFGIESRGMDLWNQKQNSDRWKIFRLSNLGHNTLVIDGKLQNANGDSSIVGFSDNPQHAYSIVDMSPVYKGQAKSVRRGIALLPTHQVLIQDELTGLQPGSRVRWGMITAGEPDDLGQNKVTLHQKGQQITLNLLAPANVTWTQIDTAKPRHQWDSPNPGTRMISFEARAPESGQLTLAVLATPGSCNAPKRGHSAFLDEALHER